MLRGPQFDRVRDDSAVYAEITSRRAMVIEPAGPGRRRAPAHRIVEPLDAMPQTFAAEAIVLRDGRPTLLVRDDTFELPALNEWRARLLPTKSKIDRAIRSVGRLEVGYFSAPYVGTAWMIADDIAITNRHVATEFARQRGDEYVIGTNPIGQSFVPRLDFKEEYAGIRPFEVSVVGVLYIAEHTDDAPDIALVKVAAKDGRRLPPPIPLFDGRARADQVVVAIGYPAEDPRNDAADQARLFGGVYDVKRVAPGMVINSISADMFSHDCTTLGGSSGSVILDVQTGAALGLHFAGNYLEANYAVTAQAIRRALDHVNHGTTIHHISTKTAQKPDKERTVTTRDLADRDGYNANFLGDHELAVPLPKLGTLAKVAVEVDTTRRGTNRYRLDYTHYSVVMHRDRGFAIFTAVNIDGTSIRRLKRTGDEPWALDPRIPASTQHGNQLYANNDLDRGHLVRRLDPCWGNDAEQAELDTFFFTNCTPQHKDFNRKLWLELEDYLLDNPATLGFKASIFTGVIFGNDQQYRDAHLPAGYWKVAVMIDTDTHQLTATGYLVSQADLITNIEFAYGQLRTYQVPITHIEQLTALNFGHLTDHDPLRNVEGLAIRELTAARDIVLR